MHTLQTISHLSAALRAQRALQERRAFCGEVAAHLREAWRPASVAAAKRRMQRCNAVRAWHGAPMASALNNALLNQDPCRAGSAYA